ncbi:MAG: bifunctional phosphoribosyl-AMP cyclohydrolase/phosphoribosyl-ATP pyrophosphatase, partial [Lachnospiraceae bacterium]|nr:bifunctional phosphoribosyl-AMP cyclohydrolase/phosphoribosyl-ATP pyrophosphatase [Lachnospiraceae bacterium]
MNVKKFIPCIYLYRMHAVAGLTDLTVVETDPVRLAKNYSENSADALIVFDMSNGDEEHARALDIIREICAEINTEVYGAGNIERMEDVKKILYAGCTKVILNYGK